jgi:hypothetical protein
MGWREGVEGRLGGRCPGSANQEGERMCCPVLERFSLSAPIPIVAVYQASPAIASPGDVQREKDGDSLIVRLISSSLLEPGTTTATFTHPRSMRL